MSFWQSPTGKTLTGSAEDAFNSGFSPIPDGTMAVAMIKSFEFIESEQYQPRYQVRWKIADGEFKNRELSQNIYAFEEDADKADKAKNMMMRIYKLCEHKPAHANAPTNADLAPMQGKLCSIKIDMYKAKDGKSRNLVSEVHESAYTPAAQEGLYDSALSKFGRSAPTSASPSDSDIPF